MRAFFTSFIVLIVLAAASIAGAAWRESNYFVQAGPSPPQTVPAAARGTTRSELLVRMHKGQETLLALLWPKLKEGLPLTSQEDAMKLASMVEKENAIPSERPRIAAVFVNRLQSGMKLESDPTIIYGLTKGPPLRH